MFHMKCLSLCPNDHEHMRDNANIRYCSLCISQIFPLNNIEEDDIFLCELNGIDIGEHTSESLSGRLFNPIQLNDKNYLHHYLKLILMLLSITILIHI